MWSYYGSKNRIAKVYPKPLHDKIYEVFAGAGYYSLLHFEKEITLVDKSPAIISIWEWLKEASIKDIERLPKLAAGTRIERNNFDSDGEYNLMRFIIVQAASGGNNIVSKWGAMRFHQNIKRLKNNIHKIKHWRFICGSYDEIYNDVATYFIDPPYTVGGHKYPFNNKNIDYEYLANWCQTRPGNSQVIVCENTAANWLPFVPLTKTYGVKKTTMEAIWTNYHTHYNNVQQNIFDYENSI